jgi:tetratricopeptide (TPR) repeat protein
LDQVFVSRDEELDRLGGLLSRAIDGEGQVCFVTGEAGHGKTSLTAEFARRAQLQQEELLVVIGDCNAQTGIGDPYLPFRELLGMLAGDIDDKVAQGMTTEENASRLRSFLRVSKRIIVDVGPDLIDIFVPGAGLVTRAGAMVAGEKGAKKGRGTALMSGGATQSMADASPGSGQSHIFEQVTTVLVTLAKQRPLVLILDDLQWIDESSASLLFHLARRIEGSRILIIGTYRPEEVSLAQGEQRHPLAQVVFELKRYYGDLVIALGDEADSESRQFVNSLLDIEANKLGDDFRTALHKRTHGHPLFTTELLRDMQERGDLVQDDDGEWVEGPALDWNALPARAEGVIEERINRLRDELRDILTIASVQGETFTAQVIGKLQEITERQLLKTLSQELDRQHRLVSEESVERVGSTRVSQFRFRHQMFQKYFYDNLGESERELLHEDVASILESLYGDRTDMVAIQLARHYEHACLDEKAASYFLQAGRRAVSVHAHREAIAMATRGLACLDRIGDVTGQSELVLDLNLLLGEAQHHDGMFAESMETYQQTAELAAKLNAPEALAMAALGYDEPRWRCNLLEPTAVKLLNQALELLEDGDNVLRVLLIAHLARAKQGSESVENLMVLLDEAVDMARRLGDPRALIESLRTRLRLDRDPKRVHERVNLIDEILEIAEQLDDKHLLLELFAFRIYDVAAIGDTKSWQSNLDSHQAIAEEISEPFYSYNDRTMRAAQSILAGRYAEAETLAQEAQAHGQKLGVENAEGVMGVQMFTIRREQGRLQEIAPLVKHFVSEHGANAAWRPGLALIYMEIGQLEEARAEFERLAEDNFSAMPHDSLWQTCLTYLAEVCDELGDAERAQLLYDLLLPYAELTVIVGNAIVCLGATSRFLGQLASTLGRWDDAEEHFKHALDLNEKLGAKTCVAHTHYQYARMLMRRGERDDIIRASAMIDEALAIAQQIGMHGLLSRIKRGLSD